MASEMIANMPALVITALLQRVEFSSAFAVRPTAAVCRHPTIQSSRNEPVKPLVTGCSFPNPAHAAAAASTATTLFAKEDPIFYDDFADAAGDSFGYEASSSAQLEAPSTPLPDFQDSDSTTSAPTSSAAIADSHDITGATVRQFSLGPDILISDYVGSLGFDEVTDWQYYLQSVDEEGNVVDESDRVDVPAPFMDPDRPSRTRSKSGAVVRVFRGEFRGRLGGLLRSSGMDNRVLIKEYDAQSAGLAAAEKNSIARIMSAWLQKLANDDLSTELQSGKWFEAASSRYTDSITNTPAKADDQHVQTLLTHLSKQKAPFTSLLGEMNLNDYYDDPNQNPNEWYKALGVKPPIPGSTWLIFDYHGLSTLNSYCQPAIVQQQKLPPQRGVFGNIVRPPPLPPFKERARYIIQGILKQMLSVVAETHEAGLIHQSLGRNSFLLSSVGMDKMEASNPYAVVVDRLRVVLSEWGFAQTVHEAVEEEEFRRRARSFGIDVDYNADSTVVELFAMAEDLHALGFVFLALLFTTLAEPASLSASMPPTDDDTWQRLFTDMFGKDIEEFRDYCDNEDVWASVVELLDREDGCGWAVLGELLLARENVAAWSKGEMHEDYEPVSARSLLNFPFFSMRII